jgi:hypothetical protein
MVACLWICGTKTSFAAALSAAEAPRATASPAATARTDLEIDGNILRFRGKPLRFFDRAETWLAVLGPTNRTRDNGTGPIYAWDSIGLELSAIGTPDGRAYASNLRIKLDRCAVGLMGVALGSGPRYREVQKALAPRGILADRPGRDLAFADMALPAPDGFQVWLTAPLRCPDSASSRSEPARYLGHIPLPRARKGDPCTFFFDEMEASASGYPEWR